MEIKRIPDVRPETPDTEVTLKVAGNVSEIRWSRSAPSIPVRKLDKDHGLDLRTGEVIDYEHITNRAEDTASVKRSLLKLRDLINANLTNPETALWVTLTNAKNEVDVARVYENYRRYWQRLRYYLGKRGHPSVEYIAAIEPQGRGAWHFHCLFFFPGKAPFIPNDEMARIWGHGFTKTQSLKGVGNPGVYLTSYLDGLELAGAVSAGVLDGGRLTEVEGRDGTRKAVVKGARLRLYPPGLNLYRHSRGVKLPEVFKTTEGEAMAAVGDAPLTYEKTISITDEAGEVKNIINYRTFTRGVQDDEQSEN